MVLSILYQVTSALLPHPWPAEMEQYEHYAKCLELTVTNDT